MSRLFPNRPLKCESCRFYQGEQYVPSCEWFEFTKKGSLLKPLESGYQLFHNYAMSITFRALGERPEFYVHRCDYYERSRSREGYKQYLKTEVWQRKRRAALKAADYRCERCGCPTNLDVHHVSYSNLGHEPMSDLVVLCRACHSSVHKEEAAPCV